MTVTFLTVAEHEVAEATEYYEQIDPELGQRFRLEVEKILLDLRAQPSLHRQR